MGIGLGLKNSIAIVNQGVPGSNDITTAAGAARAYAGGSKNDWYLPTTAELNLLCQWNRGVTQNVTTSCTGGTLNIGTGATGSGFTAYYYWSSSEWDGGNARDANFSTGAQGFYSKGNITFADHVRPVRAF